MTKINIDVSEGLSDCEDCGSYDWQHVLVRRDGEVVLTHSGDNHLGGGVWYRWQDCIYDILTALGHEVEITEVYDTE